MALIPWWISYPNVNDEIMNLDWLLRVSNENTEKISNFINQNTIKYADPILWNITSQYEANTITIDPQTGDAYISTKAVPSGVALSNSNYWTKIYNYANEMDELREQIAAANENLSTTASAPRAVGDLVWLNGLLYKVTAPMIAGDSYVVDSNCEKVTIEELLDAVHDADVELNNDITEINKNVAKYVNIVELGADNTGVNDNSTLFNQLFSNAEYEKKTFFFDDGVYLINNTVSINNGCNLVLSQNAIIKAGAAMDIMLDFNTLQLADVSYKIFYPLYKYSHMIIRGGNLDGNKLADICIHARRFCDFTIENLRLYNFNFCGIDAKTPFNNESDQTAELKILNCYITNFDNRVSNTTGIKLQSDNFISDNIIVDCYTGIEMSSSNLLTNNHIWTSNNEMANDGTGIKINGTGNDIVNLYIDNYFNTFLTYDFGVTHVNGLNIFIDSLKSITTFDKSIIHKNGATNHYYDLSNVFIRSAIDLPFSNISYKNNFSLSGFKSSDNNCLPMSPNIPALNSFNKYMWDNPITDLRNIGTGIYGVSSSAIGKPDTTNNGILFNIYMTDNYQNQIFFEQNSNKIYVRIAKAYNASWLDIAGNVSINAIT